MKCELFLLIYASSHVCIVVSHKAGVQLGREMRVAQIHGDFDSVENLRHRHSLKSDNKDISSTEPCSTSQEGLSQFSEKLTPQKGPSLLFEVPLAVGCSVCWGLGIFFGLIYAGINC